MNVRQRFYFTDEEKKKVDGVLKIQGLLYEDIAEKLKVTRPSVSQKLGGVRSLSAEEGRKIYELLKRDSLVSFLVEGQAETEQPPAENMWSELYSQYAGRLQELFGSQTTEVKGRILGDLEKLVDKYNKS